MKNLEARKPLALILALVGMFTAVSVKAQTGINGTAGLQQELVRESKLAIVSAGLSGIYFAKHFRLLRVEDKFGDRRVVWRLKINEYETEVIDSIGYYTAGGKHINIHSVISLLSPAREIIKTIPRPRAEKLMRACIGNFAGGSVIYQVVAGQAELIFNAQAVAGRLKKERNEQEKGQGTSRAGRQGRTKTGVSRRDRKRSRRSPYHHVGIHQPGNG